MAAAEVLMVTRAIDDKVKAVDDKVTDVCDKVKEVDDKIEGVDERVHRVDTKVDGIDNQVQILDSKVQSVDYKVGSVIQGKPYLQSFPPPLSLAFNSSGVKGTVQAVQLVANQVTDLNRSSSSVLFTADHETLTSVAGNELRKDIQRWIAPPDPSVNYNAASGAHHEGTAAWCTKGNTLADWRAAGSLLWIHGKRAYSIIV
jgi:hypothetical protein